MFTRIMSLVAVAAVVTFTQLTAKEQEGKSDMQHENTNQDSHAQQTCPVSGKPINKDVYVDHDGKRIYLCCASCKDKVMADPEKVISQLESQGVVLETVSHMQTNCPVMGGKIDKQYSTVYHGSKVYFCCPMCKPKFEKEPAKYMKQMKDKGIELEKARKSE